MSKTQASSFPVIPLTSKVSGVLPVANGGTAAATSAAARVNLGIEKYTAVADADYSVLSTDKTVVYTSLTVTRTATLPLASSLNPGAKILIQDGAGTASNTVQIAVARSGSDLINGSASSATIQSAFGNKLFTSDGVSNWTYDAGLVRTTASQTLTNKTLSGNIASNFINTGTITLPTVTGTVVQTASSTITSSTTPTPSGDAAVNYLFITAQAAVGAFVVPSGTPTNGNILIIRIKDDGTSRNLTWDAIYRAGTDLPLPAATVLSKTLYLKFIYNSTDSKWDFIAQIGNI